MARIIVIGAGISGLATAAFLDGGPHELRVLEAGAAPGGNVRTDREDGRTFDRAANGWLDSEPAMTRLLARASLTERCIQASPRAARWIYARGQVHAAPLSPSALLRTELLSPWAKLRILGEPLVGRGAEDVDETVAQFVSRRLGSGFTDAMVAPMVAGIHAARPDQLSLRAAFPRMWALEQEHRSLILAAMRLRSGGAPQGRLTTIRGGSGVLTATLAAQLGERLTCGATVTAVERRRDGWQVHTEDGAEHADAVVLACPGHAQAALVRGVDTELASTLESIPYSPVAVVVSAWPAGAWDTHPDGFGVLVAPGEELGGVLGTLFTSSIFPQHAPEGEVLLRTILGGAVYPEALTMDDQQLIAQCRAAMVRFFGEERAAPRAVRIYRHRRGIPLYAPGHRAKVRVIRAAQARYPGLFFTGSHLDGVGVKDCARAGERMAELVTAWLGV